MQLTETTAYRRLPLDVVGAEDCELILADGTRVLDLYGGHCVNSLGAGHPGLGAALAEQWRTLSFVTNLLDHAPRRAFHEAFASNLPTSEGGWQVFCTNSGAEANENAVKVSLAVSQRVRVVTFNGAFHGRTAAATALSDTAAPGFPMNPFEVVRLPWGDTRAAEAAIDESVGAVMLEPIQSLAGVVEPPAGFLEALRAACDRSGAALIFDEVQTGSGRLGQPWAAQHFGVVPDLFTTAKGAGAGFPIGLTVVRGTWGDRIEPGLLGSTFGGGPLALRAACEVAKAVASAGFLENVRATSTALRAASLRGPVRSVRGAGLLLGLELRPGLRAADVRDALLERGILTGTCNDPSILRLSPPLTLGPRDAQRFGEAFEALATVEV